jgi:sulfane dehydrogenase subunit SoxC
MAPRALLVPPGFPDFQSRIRVLRPGACPVRGRAWSGAGTVTRVEFTDDGGGTWREARLAPAAERSYAWQRWSIDWDARPGRYLLGARAWDSDNRVQPSEQPWNSGGFANNLVQRVPVLVTE